MLLEKGSALCTFCHSGFVSSAWCSLSPNVTSAASAAEYEDPTLHNGNFGDRHFDQLP